MTTPEDALRALKQRMVSTGQWSESDADKDIADVLAAAAEAAPRSIKTQNPDVPWRDETLHLGVAAEAAPLDVERLARALCLARWPRDPSRYDSQPGFWIAEATAYVEAYAALAATSREGGS